MARGSLELAETAQIHRSVAETPLLVVILAERGHGGGAIGSGSNLPEKLPMTADLPQICIFEGVEEIWSGKLAWGCVDDWKLPERGGP
jgi:hypothetical protein